MTKFNSKNNVLVALTISAVFFLGNSLHAENYVNWAKEYYVFIPDDWRIIDRGNSTQFFQSFGDGKKFPEYDVMITPLRVLPFYAQGYLIISSDLTGDTDHETAEKTAKLIDEYFNRSLNMADSAGVMNRKQLVRPTYDRKTRTITQVSQILVAGSAQTMTFYLKYYDKGVVTLAFYTPDSVYNYYRSDIIAIAASFGSENLEQAAETESLNVVDVKIDSLEESANDAQTSDKKINGQPSGAIYVLFGLGIVAVVGIVVLVRRKKSA